METPASSASAAAAQKLDATLELIPETARQQDEAGDPSGPANSSAPPPAKARQYTTQVRGGPEQVSEQVVVQTEVPCAPQCRFLPGKAKELIGAILREKLTGAKYDADTAPLWVREITDAIKAQLKEMELDRYKLVVQAVLGEQRGQGFQMSCRCFWDPNTDNYAHESFTNDSIFCVAGAFALYMY